MSIADVAAAVIGLRETSYKDHQRLTGSVDELRAALTALSETVDATVDKRLAASAQAVYDLQRQITCDYEQKMDALLGRLISVANRLAELTDNAESSDDPAELQARLASLSTPRDQLQALLAESGVFRFDCVGEPYDPMRHEVVRREFLPDCTHEYVKEELRPGYFRQGLDHTLVRAKVIVAAPPITSITEEKADG